VAPLYSIAFAGSPPAISGSLWSKAEPTALVGESRCDGIFLGDGHQRRAPSPPERHEEQPRRSHREQRDSGTISRPPPNDDARPVITQRCEFDGFDNGPSHDKSADARCSHAGCEVCEGTPVDELAEVHNGPGPVAAMGLRAGPEASLRVWLIPGKPLPEMGHPA
jgi:hypothetical protein